ncbi:serine hydrolase domain-containing protein [uncultured Nocardioides sp.]|uniref:serine hydrolase domain-containing protein n=1 Tax=uncultured Nocardioides sp. TaxID=198441 RepID=UPI0026037C95|nr:serine hydrolase domain-containing protein [uncultured Nocardioides sp.]
MLDLAQQELDNLVGRTGMPGAQLAIGDAHETWTVCSGAVADGGAPITPETRFPFASLTKTVTAVAGMTVVDEGRLSLDAPPSEYLPGLALPDGPDGRPVTLGDLLSHSSGLVGSFDADGPPSAVEAVMQGASHLERIAEPGETYSLNNHAFLIAAACIERVLGRGWHDYLPDRVLTPLGAVGATTDDSVRSAAGTARGHVPNRAGTMLTLPVPLAPRAIAATASLFGSAADAIAATRDCLRGAHDPDRLLTAAASDRLCEPRVQMHDPYWADAGIGWIGSRWQERVLDSRGADAGQETYLRIAPSRGTALALFANAWTRRWPYFDLLPETSAAVLGAVAPQLDETRLPRARDPRLHGVYQWESAEFVVDADASGATVLSSRNRGARGGLFIELEQCPVWEASPGVHAFRMPNVEVLVGLGFSHKDASGRPGLVHLLQRSARRSQEP